MFTPAGGGPAPSAMGADAIERLLATQPFATLATHRRDGTAALSIVVYTWDAAAATLRISTIADRLKVRHLQRDPRAAVLVGSADHMSSVVLEGTVEVSDPSISPGDATGRELLLTQRPPLAADRHGEFFAQMVTDRRLVLRLRDPRIRATTLTG